MLVVHAASEGEGLQLPPYCCSHRSHIIYCWYTSCTVAHSACSARATDMDTAFVFLLLVALSYSQSDRYLQTYPPYNETDPRTPLTFALLQSFGGAFNSSGLVAGVQVALGVINSKPELLPGYTLHYTLTDSQVSGPHRKISYIHLRPFTVNLYGNIPHQTKLPRGCITIIPIVSMALPYSYQTRA